MKTVWYVIVGLVCMSSCTKETQKESPKTYTFERNGQTSVSYSGQTDRIKQLIEMSVYMRTANTGSDIDVNRLLDMYSNANAPFSFSSTKQLKNKTFSLDIPVFEALMSEFDSIGTGMASPGVSGFVQKGSTQANIRVNKNGLAIVQFLERSIMGSVFMYQILNTYLTDNKIGSHIDNTTIIDGKNYTALEHHFDEAFGYFGAPVDFASDYSGNGELLYWARYCDSLDTKMPGITDDIMTAFIKARCAIVENERDTIDIQVSILYDKLQTLMASTVIHYINLTLATTDVGDRLYRLSAVLSFFNTLKYVPISKAKLSATEIQSLYNNLPTHLWDIENTSLETIKQTISSKYGLDVVKDAL